MKPVCFLVRVVMTRAAFVLVTTAIPLGPAWGQTQTSTDCRLIAYLPPMATFGGLLRRRRGRRKWQRDSAGTVRFCLPRASTQVVWTGLCVGVEVSAIASIWVSIS
jgi:hypothetical protein